MDVSVFIPCLIDHFMPDAAFAMIEVLEACGLRCFVEKKQSCCGQPGYNTGNHSDARALATRFMRLFADDPSEFIVVPSGSCAAMIRHSYPKLLPEASEEPVLCKIREFCEFMASGDRLSALGLTYRGSVYYHGSCHLQNVLEVEKEPLAILGAIKGLKVHVADPVESSCCGFGGSFSAALPELSAEIGISKLEYIRSLGQNVVVGADAGCLMHLRGVAEERSMNMRFYHIAEFMRLCLPSRDKESGGAS